MKPATSVVLLPLLIAYGCCASTQDTTGTVELSPDGEEAAVMRAVGEVVGEAVSQQSEPTAGDATHHPAVPHMRTTGPSTINGTKLTAANEAALPRPCQVAEWQDWGACSVSCGPGNKTRTRVVRVAAVNGGLCNDKLQETESCRVVECAVNCEVAAWGDWQVCSVGCGGGKQFRSRDITQMNNDYGTGCPDVKEERLCNQQACTGNATQTLDKLDTELDIMG